VASGSEHGDGNARHPVERVGFWADRVFVRGQR
jgi:hypothetical protein